MSRPNLVRCDACQKEVAAEEAGDWWTLSVGRSSPGTAPAETTWGHSVQVQPYIQQMAGDACSLECVAAAAETLASELMPLASPEPPVPAP